MLRKMSEIARGAKGEEEVKEIRTTTAAAIK